MQDQVNIENSSNSDLGGTALNIAALQMFFLLYLAITPG